MIWKSRIEYVSIETGEVLDKERVKLYYDIVYKKTFTKVINNTIGIKYGTIHCVRKKQTDLFNNEA